MTTAWPHQLAAPQGPAPAWFGAGREKAQAWAEEHGFPTKKDEDWKYLDLKTLASVLSELEEGSTPTGDLDPVLGRGFGLGGPRLVFVNGRSAPELWSVSSDPGVESLAAAVPDPGDPLEAMVGVNSASWAHAFDAINAAQCVDGAVIRVPSGFRHEHPIELVFISLPGQGSSLHCPRSVILAAPESQVAVVVHHVGVAGAPVCTDAVIDIVCGEGAEVDLTEVQEAQETGYHLSLLDVHQLTGSRFTARSISLGGRIARHEVRLRLEGPGAEADLDGLYLPTGVQHHDHPVLVEHVSPGATSRQVYKGVIGERAHGVFNGQVLVHPGADGTDAAQSNKNLLLSDQAEIDTRPRLEIHADDVRCTHGAAIGQLDADALYYLRSRGIPRAEAERLLIAGFADELVERIPYPEVRDHVRSRVAQRFSALQGAQGS